MANVKLGRVYASGLLKSTRVFGRPGKGYTKNIRVYVQSQLRTEPAKFTSIFTVSSPYSIRSLSTSSSYHQHLPHFKESQEVSDKSQKTTVKDIENNYMLPHPIWTEEDVEKVEITHQPPTTKVDKAAYFSVQVLSITFDLVSLYKIGSMTENKWLNRIIMLETMAGVPGMIGGMARHLKSLRKLSRDHGWIHTLLEEAENERMHLMTALELKEPGFLFRGLIIGAQAIFVNVFFIAYLLSPRFCHRFVGYLEEEAVKNYTYCLECIDNGKLPVWQHKKAPQIAVAYWKLKEDATMRDAILAIRADEAHHRVVNHTLSSLHLDQQNPFFPGQRKF